MNGNQWYRYVMAGLMCLCGVARYAGAATIEIATVEELQKIGNEGGWPLSGTYILTNDIDASETETWNEGMGFDPSLTTTLIQLPSLN
ncbi:MAG: hypothetical protein GX117_03970 [Candidatus Hydrogenedentes bacterium]|nr:hypothetical protein [Candidatus Hydrogenedentota bacterium]